MGFEIPEARRHLGRVGAQSRGEVCRLPVEFGAVHGEATILTSGLSWRARRRTGSMYASSWLVLKCSSDQSSLVSAYVMFPTA